MCHFFERMRNILNAPTAKVIRVHGSGTVIVKNFTNRAVLALQVTSILKVKSSLFMKTKNDIRLGFEIDYKASSGTVLECI